MSTKPVAKQIVQSEAPLPIGVGRVPKWWMDLTPHDKLDLAEHEAQTKMQEQMSHYYLKLAAAGLVGHDGHLVTLPDGQPDWSRIQEQRIRLNPKLFGIADKDPDFHLYETGELLPHEFKLKMQEMYGGITPNQLEYKKYGASKDDNKPSWAKMKLRHSKEGDMIRSGVDIDEGPNGYTRRFGGSPSSNMSEKPAVMIVGGKRLVRKVRRVPKKKTPLSPEKPAATQVPHHDQPSPRRSPRALSGAKAKKLSTPQANGRSTTSSPKRNSASPRRRVSPPPMQKPSLKATNGSPKRPQNSQILEHSATNGTRSSFPTHANAVGQQKANLNRQENKQPVQAMSPPRSKQVPARTPPPSKMRQISDESEAQTPVTTNNKHVHSERLMNGSLLSEPPSIRVSSYQPVAQGTHFLDARAGLKKTPPKPAPSNPPPSWRPTQAPSSQNYKQAQPIAVTRGPEQEEPRVTHKLMFLADEDDSELALVTPATDERYDEEEYEEVEEYYDHNEKVNGENLYYEEEEEVLSIHEVFVDEETVEDGSSYYEEEVIDDSGEIEYYEEEEEEAISELEAKLAAKQAQLARFR